MTTNAEWVRAALARRETVRVPYNFSFTPPAERRVREHYGLKNVPAGLNFPIRMRGMNSIKPLFAGPAEFGPTAADEWGVIWTTSQIDRGSPTGPCLNGPTLAGYRWPDPAAPHRYEGLADWSRDNRDQYTFLWIGDLWERATFMRGMEGLLADVALNRSFVEDLLDGITEHILHTEEILFATCEFDAVALSDDYGTQRGMLMSPADWRAIIRPRLGRIYALAHKHGRTVFHHSCGSFEPIIPDLIDIGLDILHPIQPEAMDIRRLKREFGSDLSFCGGVSTQDLLPRGSPEDVRREVRRLKKEMGARGGYILEPGISLQADVPTDNLVALIEEARRP